MRGRSRRQHYARRRLSSPADLGLILACQSLPLVALLLFGGVWADRLPRHRIMIATDLARAALHAVLAALILTGSARIWQLCAIEAAFGAAQAFFQPAYSGLLPQTVPEHLVKDARALSESAANVALLMGPALASVLVLGVGAGEAFAFDAATFVVSALLLARVSPRRRGRAPAPAPIMDELRAGWREVRSRTWVWVTIGAFSGAVLCVYAQWYALAPAVARELYGSTGVFGALEACGGAGAVCGALTALAWHPRRPLRAGLLLILAWPLQAAALAAGAPLAVVVCCAWATGFGFSLMMIWWESALVEHIPPHALSRVSAYDWMGSLALLPLGYVLASTLASTVGARTALALGSGAGLALMASALLPQATRELGTRAQAPEQRPHPLMISIDSHVLS